MSSETAAGYGDFRKQLSESGFAFHVQLFPAIMQGEQVEQSIIAALNMIYDHLNDFDVVCILRGGGATADLSGFDTLALAENVAQFPLPVITGIGHERDECILDMVSHTRVKTPTAAAALLIDNLNSLLEALNDVQKRLAHSARQKLITCRSSLNVLSEAIPRLFSIVRTRHEAKLDSLYQRIIACIQQQAITSQADIHNLEQRMHTAIERRLTSEQHRMEIIEEKVHSLDPTLLLKRGYSITLFKGKAVRDAKTLQKGDEIETRIEKGTIKSIII